MILMNILLGIRIAFAGGREAAARMALMAMGIAVGVLMVLLTLTAQPIIQSHTERLTWHRTSAGSPQTAPDPALWIAVTDRYAGRDIIRVHVAALGARPPVPPGVDRLPGPGEVFLSPALAELIRTVPDDQLRDRFPGRIAGTIGSQGLIGPAELVAIVGHAPEQMQETYGVQLIRGIEQPPGPFSLAALWGILFGMIAVLILGPVVVFVSMVTRIGGVRREQRFAAIRLAGATRLQTAGLAATETAGAALVGIALGLWAFRAARPLVAEQVTLGHGIPIFAEDVRVPLPQLIVAMLAVLAVAVGTTLVALGPAQITPLVRQRVRRRPPQAGRLVPLAIGVLGLWYTAKASQGKENPHEIFGVLGFFSSLSILVGLFLSGAWACMWVSRGLARVSGRATVVIVARRIAADPYGAFRSVSGAALAMFVATTLGLVAAGERTHGDTPDDRPSVLKAGVVAVHVRGAPEASLAPLMTDGVVVARLRWRGQIDGQIVVACAELARVAEVTCPLPTILDDSDWRAHNLFALPYPGPSDADLIFDPQGFAEPAPADAELPIQTLFIPTDGTRAAQERVRTLAAIAVPFSRNKTGDDLTARPAIYVTGLADVLPYAIVFVLLVTACSLTVSVTSAVLERRRPFALLRASGVRLGELRRIVLLETGVPLALTVFGSVGLAVLVTYLTLPPSQWVLPEAGFFAGLGIGVLAAFAVSLITLPFMNIATRHDTARFE